MKRLWLALFVFTLVTGICTAVQASFFQDDLQPVCFWVVDDNSDPAPNGNDEVTLSFFGVISAGWTLEYGYDNVHWTTLGASGQIGPISTGPDDWELIYFRLSSATAVDDMADLEFLGPEGDLWNSVTIFWNDKDDYTNFSSLVAWDDDNVAPVPIPGSALILGSGILSLIIFGRRRRQIHI